MQNSCAERVPVASPSDQTSIDVKYVDFAYGKKLFHIRVMATVTNLIYTANWFLGVCSLTWASAVILGGMIADISKRDFYSVIVLLIVEALRLATQRFFSYIHFIWGGRPSSRSILQYSLPKKALSKELLRRLVQVLELSVLGFCIVISSRRLIDLRRIKYERSEDDCKFHGCSKFDVFGASLRIFYIVVLSNGILSVCGFIYSRVIVYRKEIPYSRQMYFSRILWDGIQKGHLGFLTEHASLEMELLQVLADVYERNELRNCLAIMNKMWSQDLVKHLYNHCRGFEAAYTALDSNDDFLRDAAAGIIGLWVDFSNNPLEGALLRKLADALDHHQTGMVAAWSFSRFVRKHGSKGAQYVKNSREEGLVDIVIKRILSEHKTELAPEVNTAHSFHHLLACLIEVGAVSHVYIDKSVQLHLLKFLRTTKLKSEQIAAAYALIKLPVLDSEGCDKLIGIIKTSLFNEPPNSGDQPRPETVSTCYDLSLQPAIQWLQGALKSTCDHKCSSLILLPGKIILAVFAEIPKLIVFGVLKLWWNIILELAVLFISKRASADLSALQLILDYEVDVYLKQVTDFVNHKQVADSVNHNIRDHNNNRLPASWRKKVEVIDSKTGKVLGEYTNVPKSTLPSCLQNVEDTSNILIVGFVFLCLLLIFYWNPHLKSRDQF